MSKTIKPRFKNKDGKNPRKKKTKESQYVPINEADELFRRLFEQLGIQNDDKNLKTIR